LSIYGIVVYSGFVIVVEILLRRLTYINSILPFPDSHLRFIRLHSLGVCVYVVRSRKRAKELKLTIKEVVRFKGSVLKVSLRSKYTSAAEKYIYRKLK
jgi:hypothetical protein